MTTFSVTYEIYPASTDNEEFYYSDGNSGFIAQNVSLRDAIDYVNQTRSSHCSQQCIEANDSRIDNAEWFTVYNSMDWDDGRTENRSLHIPDSVTGASRRRIARLLGISR